MQAAARAGGEGWGEGVFGPRPDGRGYSMAPAAQAQKKAKIEEKKVISNFRI